MTSVDDGVPAAEVPPYAAPALPTPLARLDLVVAGDDAGDEPEVRWCRQADDRIPSGAPRVWKPTAGAVAALPGEPPSWLVGAGAGSTAKDWRAVGAAAVRAARDAATDPDGAADGTADGEATDVTPVTIVRLRPDHPDDAPDDADGWAALVTGVVLGSHRFSLRSTPPPAPPTVRLAVPAEHRGAVDRAAVLARATALARDLADTPSGAKSPDWFARTAVGLVDGAVATTVRDEHWLAEHEFGGVLAVGGGSSRPPRLLELAWAPAGAQADGRASAGSPDRSDPLPHVVLVGKGITFDTGGISIKPNAGMADMRTDCSGGAAVVAALDAVARLGLGVRVTGLVPLAENHVSGSAYRPGDVVRHHGGTTSEVTNTDAEGRMVLADALVHAVRTLDPDVVVDVATLTGAMKVALGVRTGGVFATTPALADELVAAGAATGEPWWPMPLIEHLESDVDSAIADVRQAPPGPGGVVAALFLRRFSGGVPWAHLDIAGPARCDGPHEEVAKGATGFAARTLVSFCAARAG